MGQFDSKGSTFAKLLFFCLALCFSPVTQAATAAGESLFDHTKTGFILKDVHTTLRCEQCHLDGVFKNTPKDCAGCHTTGSRIGASPKPINHVQTTETCDTCHSSASSFQVKSFTHAGIASGEVGNCESCHNGQSQGVTSKPANHFPTLQPCGLCHTNTVEFRSWTMDHKGLVSDCVSCHGATAEKYPGVVFKPVAHIPTVAACETCHPSTKFDNFNGASFIHVTSGANNVKNNCKSCHTGQYKGVTAKHAGHIYDANAQCDVCHTSANTNGYTSFLGVKYNHVTATTPLALGNCFRCHDSATVTATKKTSTHIATTAACDSCHTRANTSNYTTFKGAKFHGAANNANLAACSSCHNGATAKGVAAAVPTHVATTARCDSCHANAVTSGFKSFLGAIYIHTTPAGVCSSCHIGTPGTAFGSRTALGKSTNHVVTNAPCDTCHNQTNTSNYTTFKGALYVHATPPGVCSSCHKPGGPGLDKSVNHVPIGAVACDKCHTQSNTANYTTFFGAIFVHASPMLDRCDSCHFTNGPGKAKTFIPNHVSTSEDCAVCHTTATTANYTTFVGALYIHPSPITACAACHNGTIARTKSAVHVPIGSAACETCHDAKNFKTFFGAMIHTPANSTPGVCKDCHTGVSATGVSATHVPIAFGVDCVTCHDATNTNGYKTFLGGRFVHVSPVATCTNCHGVTARGKTATHVPAALISTCDTCHTPGNTNGFTTFLGGLYPHPAETTCKTCHNGITALGEPIYKPHGTGSDCVPCHAVSTTNQYASFLGATVVHPFFTPGVDKCSDCHNGVGAKGLSATTHIPLPTNSTCDSCHKNASIVPSNFSSFLVGPPKFHPANIAGTCSTCHNGTMATGKNTGHVTTAAACDTCHANAKPAFATWLGASYIHTIASGTCATCHTGTAVFGSKTPSGKSALHVPTGEACDTCHANAKTSYLNWLGWTYIHPTPMVDACETCHRTGGFALAKSAAHVPTSADCGLCHTPATIANYTTFLGAKFVHISPVGACANCHYAGGPGLVGSVNHLPTTAACEQCHDNKVSGNFTTFMGAVFHTPANVNPGVCSTCHNGAIASGKSAAHVTTNAACSDCHTATNTNSYKTFFGATYVHPTPPGVCANCHNGAIATGMSATHIPVNGAACDTCHNATNTNGYKTFFGATYVHANPAGICSTCHNGIKALGKNAIHVVTTAACDVCHTPTNTTNFTTFKGGNYPHPTTGVAGLCSTCHNGITATGVTPYHVQTTAECDTCHAASVTNGYKTFFGGIYPHPTSGLAACSSCHNGLKARGPSAVHITTTIGEPCETCHKNAVITPFNFTSFSVNVVFVHGATPGVCSACHTGINGIRAKGMSAAIPSHVPTSVACDTCHANAKSGYTSWLGAAYIHPSAVGACETCHNGNTLFSTKRPRGKPLTHVPTTAACETCHLSTATFLGAAYVHPVPAGVCESCHNGAYTRAYAKTNTPNHVPTAAACDTCHAGAKSYAPTGWATAVTYIHTNPAGTCATCHNGTTIFGPTSTPKGMTPALHVTTNAACDLCHIQSLVSQSWTQPMPAYVHETPPGVCSSCHKPGGPGMTMDITKHVVTAEPCDLCHTQANTGNFTSFLGAVFVHSTPPGVCSSCHKPGGPGKNMSATHISIPASAGCDTCHTPANTNNYKTFLGAKFDHTTAAPGSCGTCHNGTTARGKLLNHVVTIAACDVCHTQTNTANFTTFLGGFYPHPAETTCNNCHNGTIATGMPGFHITTQGQECKVCHLNFTTFAGAIFDHASYPGAGTSLQCETCHNGQKITIRSPSANHVFTTIPTCATCHKSFISFLGAIYIHESTAGVCATCHNGITARTKSAAHVLTSAACEVCHLNDTSNDFTSFSVSFKYVHATPAGVCSTCHNGVSIYGPSTAPQGKIAALPVHVSTTAACDTCHANAKTTYASWAGAAYIHATPAGVCSTCHNGTSIYGTKTPNGKSATHVPTTATCDKCHTKTNTGNYTTWFGATFIHLTPVGTCSTCHGGVTYGSLAPQGKVAAKPVHVPTTAQCSVCHTKTNTLNYTTFAGGNIYVHATPAGTCSTCHAGGMVYGASTTPLGKSAIHVPTVQKCDLCHTKTITSSYKFWTAAYVHEATPGVCTTCHGGTWTYSGTAPRSKASAVPTHAPTNEACDLCHTKTNTSNYTTFTGAVWTHINPGGLCDTCHIDGQLFPLAKGKQPGHFVTTAQCDTCHTQTNTLNYTTFLGAYFAHPSTVAGTCSNCHNGAIALGKPSWHMLTTEQCDVCHTQTNTSNYMTFNGAVINVDHSTFVNNCLSCHNGSGAKGVNNAPGHIPVANIQCDGCHDRYNDGTIGAAVLTFALSPTKGMNHVLTAATRCDVCHNGSYTTQGPMGAMGKVTKHIPTTITGSLDCTACHRITVSASVATMTWANQVMNHNGAQGGGVPILCITCHFTGTTYQGSMQKKSHEGASATKDCSSAGCHRPRGTQGTAYLSW